MHPEVKAELASLLDKPLRVLAIDPGLSGAVALVGGRDIILKRDFRGYAHLAADIQTLLTAHARADHLLVELVGARPGQGVVSMFHFGEATGVALGAIQALRPDSLVERVAPLAWKNFFRKRLAIPKGKEVDARQICLDLFPDHACFFKRVKDHNSADAVLMGLWKLHHL